MAELQQRMGIKADVSIGSGDVPKVRTIAVTISAQRNRPNNPRRDNAKKFAQISGYNNFITINIERSFARCKSGALLSAGAITARPEKR